MIIHSIKSAVANSN